MPITHAYIDTKPDPADASLVGKSKWNAGHIGLTTDADFITLVARATALDARAAALDARIAALEGGIIPGPVGTTRMFPLPVTTATHTVPDTIDHTGATDVTTALNAYIATVPDGSIIDFTLGGTYKISSRLLVVGRNNLIFEGHNNTTLNNVGVPTGTTIADFQKSTFYVQWTETKPNHITIQNFISTAHNPSPGVSYAYEFTAFANFDGGTYLEISGIVGGGYYGDFVTLNENSSYVWVHNNAIANAGRQASVSIMCGHDITIEDNTFGPSGYCGFDIEPESLSIANISNIVLRRNTFSTFGNSFISVDGVHSGKIVSNVLVDSNTITGAVLDVRWAQPTSARMSNITFTNNTSDTSGSGPLLKFQNIDGLTVTGNTQAHSGTLVSTTSCTATNIQAG